jgi:hypothetical protein
MARKKPAKKAKKKPAAKALAKRSGSRSIKKASKKPAKKTASSYAKASSAAKASADRSAAKKKKKKKAAKPAKRAVAKKAAPPKKAAAKKALPKKAATSPAAGKKPNLDRPRKTVADIHGIPSSLDANRGPSAAKSGRADMKDKLAKNTTGGAAITAGDVDANWESAESVGDEAPGGDNPTPDQDVVDDIGRALGVEYDDDEELQGGAEISDRDRHRWELDPSSKDDFDETE